MTDTDDADDLALPDYSQIGCPSCGSFYTCSYQLPPFPEWLSDAEIEEHEANAEPQLFCAICGVVDV